MTDMQAADTGQSMTLRRVLERVIANGDAVSAALFLRALLQREPRFAATSEFIGLVTGDLGRLIADDTSEVARALDEDQDRRRQAKAPAR